jgi:hypothetical protein
VRIWDLASRQILFELEGNDNPVIAWKLAPFKASCLAQMEPGSRV